MKNSNEVYESIVDKKVETLHTEHENITIKYIKILDYRECVGEKVMKK
jgi:hypothetical protein